MAISARTRRDIDRLLQRLEPRMRDAFRAAIRDIVDSVRLQDIVRALELGDVDAAVAAMNIDAAAFNPLRDAMRETYKAGGVYGISQIPAAIDIASGARVVFRFDLSNPAVEGYLRDRSSNLITRITDEQRDIIRRTLGDGFRAGANPRTTALNIIGRIDPTTGRRAGGIVGLSEPFAQYVETARAELRLGDVESLRNYLTRERRDRRFDAAIRKALATGRPVPKEVADAAIGRYSDRLLQLRGETIARTETIGLLNRGRLDAIRQQIESGQIAAQDVTKSWSATLDSRTRDTHEALDGQTVGIGEYFVSESGATLAYPGDPEAPPEESINCRCVLGITVDYLASVVRRERERRAA